MARQVATCTCCKSLAFLCLFVFVLLRCEPAMGFVVHKQTAPDASTSAQQKLNDAVDLKLPSSWFMAGKRRNPNLDKQASHLPAASVDEEFNHEVLGEVDNSKDNGDDVRQFQSAHSFETSSDSKAESLLTMEASTEDATKTDFDAVDADKLDSLVREPNEENKVEKENQTDSLFQQAEEIKAKLDYEIHRTRFILMRLRSLQRNIDDAQVLAKKMVESDVVSKSIKDYAIKNLGKSVENAKKVLVKM